MTINSAKLIYFSPTQATRKVMEGIAQGVQLAKVEHLDLTPPKAMTQEFAEMHDELAIIGSPVYSGRLPSIAISRLRQLKGNGSPAVIVVVYGNRAYEDALLELRDVALEAGFKPIAAGAFIGEHSFSTNCTPIAIGRPDVDDLGHANAFGEMIRAKMQNIPALDQAGSFYLPGNFPYKELRMLADVSSAIQESLCTKCMSCSLLCPTAAINVDNPVVTDKGLCIRCCACVKSCPAGAKTMDDPRIKQIAEQLSVNCSQRKEPETYL